MNVTAKPVPTGNLFEYDVPTVRQLVDSAGEAYKAYATENVWVLNGREQFSMPRYGNEVISFTTGEDYFSNLCDALAQAKRTIYIADWMINWDAQMRPGGPGAQVRLFDVLLSAVKTNTKLQVYVMPWKHIAPVQTYDDSTKTVFEAINKIVGRQCVWVTLAQSFADDDSGFFSHHQKFVVVDEKTAFVGGMDLCYGRFDDATYTLKADAKGREGMNRYNGCVPHLAKMEASEVVDPFHFNDAMLKRVQAGASQTDYNVESAVGASLLPHSPSPMTLDPATQPRMPWQDVNVRIDGPSAYDVARNFILRWNSEGRRNVPLELPEEPEPQNGQCGVQVLRSAPAKMRMAEYGGLTRGEQEKQDPPKGKQCEIAQAMCNLIRQATSFIYIENQFFVSGFVSEHTNTDERAADVVTRQPLSGPAALIAGRGWSQWATRLPGVSSRAFEAPKNFICEELGNRIGRTIMSGVKENFHVMITLPVHPEGMLNDGAVITQVHWTMQSLVFGAFSLLNRVRRFIKAKEMFDAKDQDWQTVLKKVDDRRYEDVDLERCREYVTLLNLRNWEKLGERYVTEQIYVHNKTMIVDDRFAIVGSANINDRSMLGSRDSEIAVLVADSETEQYDIDGSGKPKVTRNFARMLRQALWKKIFGITGNVRPAKSLEEAIEKPASPESWKAIQKVADANTALYEAAFAFIPRNKPYGADENSSNHASIWSTLNNSSVRSEDDAIRAAQAMPFSSAFWIKPQHKPQASSLTSIQGFVTSLPIFWTKGENNNMRYATSLVVKNDPENASFPASTEVARNDTDVRNEKAV